MMETQKKTYLSMLIILALVMVFAHRASAMNYCIDQNHASASDSNPGTIDRPWKTFAKANSTLAAGDTVYVKQGTYSSYIAPVNSGTSSSRITYRNFGTDIVTVQNAAYGINLNGKSYVTVQGINFYNLDRFLFLQNGSSYNIIAYCNFDQIRNYGSSWAGSRIIGNSKYNWIKECRFSKYGQNSSGDDSGVVLEIGDEEDASDSTSNNLIENCVMFHGGHHVVGIASKYNVVRNNYFHNDAWAQGPDGVLYGNRVLYLGGYAGNSGWNLIEGNRIGYGDSAVDSKNGNPGITLATSYNIIRNNSFYHNTTEGICFYAGSTYYCIVDYNKIYNNTFLHNGYLAVAPSADKYHIAFTKYSGGQEVKYNSVRNNIYYYKNRGVYGFYAVVAGDQSFANDWDGDVQGDPKFVNAGTAFGDPMDPSYPDLSLQATSPCVDKGTFLTNVTSVSGSGKVFQVSDSRYFTDGWGVPSVLGDEIQLFGSSQRARITKIDYSTNTITVDTNLTWAQNQGVSLAYEGAAPDIGAFELSQAERPEAPKNMRITQ